MSILFYCNVDTLCSNFVCLSIHKINIKRQKLEYYYFGYFLWIAVRFYGENGIKDADLYFYHGLSRKMVFKYFQCRFCSPTSLTTSLRVAKVCFVYSNSKNEKN